MERDNLLNQIKPENYPVPGDRELKKNLRISSIKFYRTMIQNLHLTTNMTIPSKGICRHCYRRPLFSSKINSNPAVDGPSFSKPIAPELVTENRFQLFCGTYGSSRAGDSHLGHVFDDGPADKADYVIVSTVHLSRFIPYDDMDAEGCSFSETDI